MWAFPIFLLPSGEKVHNLSVLATDVAAQEEKCHNQTSQNESLLFL